MRKLSLLLLPISLIASCSKAELRSDIKEFISGFSLTESMEIYKKAGYHSTLESVVSNEKKNEYDEVSFDIRDDANISYTHTLTTYINDSLSSSESETIVTEDGKYIHTRNGSSDEYTASDCSKLVRTYFYRSEPVEGFHDYAMYYGDYISGVALRLQSAMTVDKENNTLTLEYTINDTSNDARVEQIIKVGSTGMLLYTKNKTTKLSTGEYVAREITTFKD